MFGSDDKNQTDQNMQADNTAHATMGVSEGQIEEVDVAPPPPLAPLSTPAAAPTAPPLNGPVTPLPASTTKTIQPPPLDSTSLEKDLDGVSLENGYIEDAGVPMPKDSSQAGTPPPTAASLMDDNHDNLLNLKQKALQNLSPLVDKLDQTPEEKFKTTMMLIQASDNADLIPDAYDAANAIKDEKARAQALLDVVNEINYFTQHQEPETKPAKNS